MIHRYKIQQDKGQYCLKGCDDGDLMDYASHEAVVRKLEAAMNAHLYMLDEIDEAEMMFELGKREGLRRQGLCDYCSRPWDTDPSCKFPHRHSPTPVVRAKSPALR